VRNLVTKIKLEIVECLFTHQSIVKLVNKGQQLDPYKLAVIDRWPLLASVTRWGLHILKCVNYFLIKSPQKLDF